MKKLILLACIFSLAACGGGGGDIKSGGGESESTLTFHAYNFRTNSYYSINADLKGAGDHCRVYVEHGWTVDPADIQDIINNFEIIYPKLRDSYGEEKQNVNGDSKIYILLLDIQDDFNWPAMTGYTDGYFNPVDLYMNERHSNRRKVLYMDIHPGLYFSGFYYPKSPNPNFRDTLAHEFQHLIHYNIKPSDDTWLNEAMSEVASFYAFNEPRWNRVELFQRNDNHSNSLTNWSHELADYAVVYMWAQYMADRFPNDVFRNILAVKNQRGKDSVEEYLGGHSDYLGKKLGFASVFRDWSIAMFFGDNTTVFTDNAVWTYKSINTWPGSYNGVSLPGLFKPANLNRAGLRSLGPWSIGYDWRNDTTTSLLRTRGESSTLQASFYTPTGGLTFNMAPNTPYAYDDTLFLILQNTQDASYGAMPVNQPTSSQAGAASSTHHKTPPTPAEKLSAFSTEELSQGSVIRPIPVCMQDILSHQAEEEMLSD